MAWFCTYVWWCEVHVQKLEKADLRRPIRVNHRKEPLGDLASASAYSQITRNGRLRVTTNPRENSLVSPSFTVPWWKHEATKGLGK